MKKPILSLFSILFISTTVFVSVHHNFGEASPTNDVALAFFENNLEAYADEHGGGGVTCYASSGECCSQWNPNPNCSGKPACTYEYWRCHPNGLCTVVKNVGPGLDPGVCS
ncbi:MAG: hypothetical protein WDZ29_06145 [Balneolaceae bacterium]